MLSVVVYSILGSPRASRGPPFFAAHLGDESTGVSDMSYLLAGFPRVPGTHTAASSPLPTSLLYPVSCLINGDGSKSQVLSDKADY